MVIIIVFATFFFFLMIATMVKSFKVRCKRSRKGSQNQRQYQKRGAKECKDCITRIQAMKSTCSRTATALTTKGGINVIKQCTERVSRLIAMNVQMCGCMLLHLSSRMSQDDSQLLMFIMSGTLLATTIYHKFKKVGGHW